MKGQDLSNSAVVIVATIGKPTLRRTIESILRQTHKDTRCLVVVDGEKHYDDAADVLYGTSRTDHDKNRNWGNRVQQVTLPQNTGANGYVCHRIYGAMPMLVNQDFIFYCDDDNWFDPDHVSNCVRACTENNLDWSFSLRNVYHNGEFLCRDECESVGLWPVWYDPDTKHIDTNCYCLRRELAVSLAPRWHKSRLGPNREVMPSADTILANVLTSNGSRFALVPNHTVNYELGSWELSPPPEFFLDGNRKFAQQHGGKLPWEAE